MSTKDAPVIGVQSTFQQQKVCSVPCVTKINRSKNVDSEKATQATDNNLEPSPPIAPPAQPNYQHRDRTRADQIADQIYLQDTRTLQRHHNNGENHEYDRQADPPQIELVAEQVIGAGGDHTRLQAVERSGAERDGHDENDADDPGGELLEKEEERDTPRLRGIARPSPCPSSEEPSGAYEGEDDCHGNGSDGSANYEVLVCFGSERAHPEAGDKEVVG